ncbi:MAG: cadherin-like domain-containing protein, partial [Gammaproteobacteria bacterium]
MSSVISKTGVFRIFLAAAALALSACGGSSSDSSNVSGFAQKGPMVGATIMVYPLDDSGARSGQSAGGTTDANGYYSITVPWAGPSEVVAEGTYTDELTGLPSAEVITIRAVAHVVGSTVCNLNLFTHLSGGRTLVDMGTGTDFDTARAAAITALLAEFGLDPDTHIDTLDILDGAGTQAAENAQLLLASAAISKHAVNDHTVTTTDLLDSLEADFSDDGLLNASGADTLDDIGTVASTIDLDTDITLTGTDLPDSTDLVTPGWLNHIPVAATVAAQSTDEDTASAGISLGGSDTDGDSLQVEVTTGPSNGSLNVTAGNAPLSVVYTPGENYNGGDSFQFRVSDGIAESDPVSVAITVNAVNDAPVATPPATVNTSEDTSATNISLTGTDTEHDALTVEIVNNPGHGGLTFTGNTA